MPVEKASTRDVLSSANLLSVSLHPSTADVCTADVSYLTCHMISIITCIMLRSSVFMQPFENNIIII